MVTRTSSVKSGKTGDEVIEIERRVHLAELRAREVEATVRLLEARAKLRQLRQDDAEV